MRQARVVTEFWFEPSQGFDVRASLTFSDATKVRLNPENHALELKLDASTRYPTDANLSVRTRTASPEALRGLLLLEVDADLPLDPDGASPTSVGLRVYDGTDERWWDGASWAVAAPGEWNTEAEVNANLASFPVSDRAFGLVFNPVTTDDRYTPSIRGARVLWQGPVDWVDDVLIDSLTATLQDELVYVEDLALPPLEAAAATFDLDDYADDGRLVVADLDAVFDVDADPDLLEDLLSSYDAGARVATLNVAIPEGHRPYVRALVRPSVVWDTNQDFTEVARLPEVCLRDAGTPRSTPYPSSARTGVVNRATGAGVQIEAPYRATFEVSAEVRVDRSRTQARLLEALMRFLSEGPPSEAGPFLRTRATDRLYRIRLIEELRAENVSLNLADVRTFHTTFLVEDVALELRAARDTYAVTRANLGFANVRTDNEQSALAADAPVPSTALETVEVT